MNIQSLLLLLREEPKECKQIESVYKKSTIITALRADFIRNKDGKYSLTHEGAKYINQDFN